MDKFVVTGIPGFDGDWPIDIGSFSMMELHIIKDVAGVRAGELEEAFGAGDTDVILAVAACAVRRNGGDWKAFLKLAWESEMGSLTFVADEEVEDPPIPTPLPDSESSEATADDSGNASSSDGEDLPETPPAPIGVLRSGTGAA